MTSPYIRTISFPASLRCAVAENECAHRAWRQRLARPENIGVHKIEQQRNFFEWDLCLTNDAFPAHFVHRNVTQDSREHRWHFLPRHRSVTKIDRRNSG